MHRPTSIRCECADCNPPSRITWNHVLLVTVAGTVAMIVDLAGYTPAIGAALELIR